MRTRLSRFLFENRIRPRDILPRVSFSRSMLTAMSTGRSRGSAGSMAETRAACSAILNRDVAIEELFGFEVQAAKPAGGLATPGEAVAT